MGFVIIVLFVALTRREEFGGGKTSVKRKTTINLKYSAIRRASSTPSHKTTTAMR
jgi:hypothetical protein